MRSLFLIVFSAVAGILIQTVIAQNNHSGVLQLNHVGLAVDDFDESLAFYTGTMGFEEAFRVNDEAGNLRLAYLRVSDRTFIELAPATAEQSAGLTHFGIQVDDVEAVAAMYKSRGANPGTVFTGFTNAILSFMADPQGVQIELSEYPPDSLPGQALAGR